MNHFPLRPDMYQIDEMDLPPEGEHATGPARVGLVFLGGIFVLMCGALAFASWVLAP